MKIEKLSLEDVRYNPERCAFEARVTVHDAGRRFGYPAHFASPLNAEFQVIARGLTEKAIALHKTAKPGLRSQLRSVLPASIQYELHYPRAA